MLRLIIRRLLLMLPVIFTVASITFFLLRLAPGSPFANEKAFEPQVIAALNEKYGLNRPLHVQYFNYLKQLLKADLGPSTRYIGRSVNEIIAEHLPHSIKLGLAAYSIALLVGLPLGILSAVYKHSIIDYLAMAIAVIGVSVPSFVLGPTLVLIFSLTLFWLPPARWGSLEHLVLPSITLSAAYIAYIARISRSQMLEVLSSDYIRTAFAKGLSPWTVITRHALRGATIPVVSFSGPALALLLTGTIVVERIFAIPGLGHVFIEAANARDYSVVMGITLFVSIATLIMNLLVDILLGILDPRISFK
ncbi:MAG: ABC transporter permease [Acidobacteriota bacterium]|nr:ABC transporter permease [Blastocatellia bacterium]MDW8411112.1 ABC transporter permease [Acidobacteriota bacterium]